MTLALLGIAVLAGLAVMRRSPLPDGVTREPDGSLTTHQQGSGNNTVRVRQPHDGEAGQSSPGAAGLVLFQSLFGGTPPAEQRTTKLTPHEAHSRARHILGALKHVKEYIQAQPNYHGSDPHDRRYKHKVKAIYVSRVNGEIKPILAADGVPTDAQMEQIVIDMMHAAYQPWGDEHIEDALSVLWTSFGP